jgi:hypothetical protein
VKSSIDAFLVRTMSRIGRAIFVALVAGLVALLYWLDHLRFVL